ncbi:MAG: phosphopyruvate hydratase [Myxococcota bacterium]
MHSSKNLELKAHVAKDSRGRDTVEVHLTLGNVTTVGDVPAGASKGEDEAQTMAVPEALTAIHETIQPMLRDLDADLSSHSGLLALEDAMIEKGGENFKDLGANACLPVSRALWRAAAKIAGKPLHQYIFENEPDAVGSGKVFFYMNIFNGGLHALKEDQGEVLGKDRIDVQEVMVAPVSATSYAQALEMGEKIDQALKKILIENYGEDTITRADEAGFSVKGLGDSSEAFARVFQAVEAAGYVPGKDVKLCLDVAASSFVEGDGYRFRGELLSSDQMVDFLVGFADEYEGKVLSIEDGLGENDWSGWTRLTAELKKRDVLTIGDDLFVTQMPRLSRGIESKAANAILIKVNQNGTVRGTIEVMKAAKQAGMECVVSHRSGETLDDSIADLAYGTRSLGLKTGDPQPEIDFPDKSTWVRRVKYLRMLEIEKGL